MLARELYLPSNLGQGALKANPAYLKLLPVADPRRAPSAEWSALEKAGRSLAERDLRRNASGRSEDVEARRREVDRAFLIAAGVDEDVESMIAKLRAAFEERTMASAKPVRNPGPKIGRNEPCPCGSGRKFKNCCMR